MIFSIPPDGTFGSKPSHQQRWFIGIEPPVTFRRNPKLLVGART
jgi:hypothetical protein